ncbi:MAG: nitronate monooxygenase [Actinomycetia bacterium]|nr:nitronate monooxygenase [Actinomycetes bacterium]
MRTRVTELLGIQVPVVQGGLAYLAHADLCAAVSAAGGLGQLTATTMPSPDALREEIRAVRAATDRPFGVNFALGRRDVTDLLAVATEEAVPVVSVTGGDPAPVLERLAAAGFRGRTLVLVSSVRQAVRAERLGADLVAAVGQEGGGHIGRNGVGTFVLVPAVAEAVRIPVLAGGGIADARGLVAALALGAEGVEMGTRFVATAECRAHARYKAALVAAGIEDTTLVEASLGHPGRVLDGPIPRVIRELEAQGASFEELRPFVRGETNVEGALGGNLEGGFVWAGQAAGLVRDVPTVAELFRRLVAEAAAVRERLGRVWPAAAAAGAAP